MNPLTVTIPCQFLHRQPIKQELAFVAISAVVRGLIFNTLSDEYNETYRYWKQYCSRGRYIEDKVRLDVDEAFEHLIDALEANIDLLSQLRTYPDLTILTMNYDVHDGSITVRIIP